MTIEIQMTLDNKVLKKCKMCKERTDKPIEHHIKPIYWTNTNKKVLKQGFTVFLCKRCHYKLHKIISKQTKNWIESKWIKEIEDIYKSRSSGLKNNGFAWNIATEV